MTAARHLSAAQLHIVAALATGESPRVRDAGLMESAAERPATAVFGAERFPGPHDKAAALMHSIARFHPLVDGNKRLAWLGAYVVLTANGVTVTADDDEVFEITMAVAEGRLTEVGEIAAALASVSTEPTRR